MTATNKLLDRYAEVCQLKTNMAIAARLGITRSAVSNWRYERSHAEPELVEKMAKACKLDAEEWVLLVQADREFIPARKQVWLRAAQRLAATAALVAITFCLDVHTAKANPIDPGVTSRNQGIMYIM
jgi:transcriptional regulator with XRE-family HTH domain